MDGKGLVSLAHQDVKREHRLAACSGQEKDVKAHWLISELLVRQAAVLVEVSQQQIASSHQLLKDV